MRKRTIIILRPLVALIAFYGTIVHRAGFIASAVNCEDFHKVRTSNDSYERSRFSAEQVRWFCEQTATMQSEPPPSIRLTNYQRAFLDFNQRCEGSDCRDFKFVPDSENATRRERRQAALSDWRCTHAELSWRPMFCRTFSKLEAENLRSNQEAKLRQKRQNLPRAVRKEYRMLSDDERHRLHAAIKELKRQSVDNMSKWDLFTFNHDPANAPGAHWGPAFLPWHRELLRQLEVALRNIDPEISLPYWDNTLDWGLPNPRDSVLWTEKFLGNGNGYVNNGPFASWSTLTPLSKDPSIQTLYRTVADDERGGLYSPADVEWILSRQTFTQLTFCDDRTFEMLHGLVHLFVGGFMEPIRLSPNDPVFYFLHAYVDYLWETWRNQHQTPWQRENDWMAPDKQCKNQNEHSFYGKMVPFNRTENRDGLSLKYTQRWYTYEDRPKCYTDPVTLKKTCGSKYIFCDERENRCRSKIRSKGNCTGLENTDACLESTCVSGSCKPWTHAKILAQRQHEKTLEAPKNQFSRTPARSSTVASTATTRRRVPETTTTATKRTNAEKFERRERPKISIDKLPILEEGPYPKAFMKVLLFGKSGKLINQQNYSVHVRGINYNSSESFTPISESNYPEHSGLAYLRFRRPSIKDKIVGIRVTAFNPRSSPCLPFCYDPENGKFGACDGFVTLSPDPTISDPVAYGYNEQAKQFLNVDLSGHPTAWSVNPPYLNFLCDGERDPKKIRKILRSFHPDFSKSKQVFLPILVVDKESPFQLRLSDGATISVVDSQRKVSVKRQIPARHSGPVFITTRNPLFSRGPVTLRFSAQTATHKKCLAMCVKEGEVSQCPEDVNLSLNAGRSFAIPFTAQKEARNYLGWNMTGHPMRWMHKLSPLRFYC